jgi:hypothetical protein
VDLVAEALKRAQVAKPGRCWFLRLSPETQQRIAPVIELPLRDVPHSVVLDVINEALDLQLSKSQLENHRRGQCACTRQDRRE